MHKLAWLILYITDKLNGHIIIKETDFIIQNPLKEKPPGPDGFAGKFYQRFKEELTPILYTLYQKTEEEGTHHNSFYESSITSSTKNRKR